MIQTAKSSAKIRNQLVFRLVSVLFSIVAFEILLRLLGINKTYTESIGQGYESYFNEQVGNYYGMHRVSDTFTLDHKDFRFFYRTNELGLREMPLDSFVKRSESGMRILTLGDSFTDGVGASREESYPRLLEALLWKEGRDVHVFNAGISGHDPFFEFVFLRDKLMRMQPHLVIIGINASDVTDYFFRGGMERFQIDGTVKTRTGPWYEPLYKISYVFRFFIVTICRKEAQLFVTEKEADLQAEEFFAAAIGLMDDFKTLLPNGSRLLVVVFPSPVEAVNKDYHKNVVMKKRMADFLLELKSKNIDTLNLFPRFESLINEENYYEFSYKNDGHFTPYGYSLFASFVSPVADSLTKAEN